MPFDPTEVRSRDELLMGAIATGDSTVIGDPRDRNEEFIKAIADGIGSAGGHLYVHHINGLQTIDGVIVRVYIQILSADSTSYTTLQSIIEHFDKRVDGVAMSAGTNYAYLAPYLFASTNDIKGYGQKIIYDSDTGTTTITGWVPTITVNNWNDDVVQEI